MSIIDQYFEQVFEYIPEAYVQALKETPKASIADITRLVQRYPRCPELLIQCLTQYCDGTYHREPPQQMLLVPILGSDVGELPYYLLSVDDMLEECQHTDSIEDIYGEEPDPEMLTVDPLIDTRISMAERLCFAHCVNNGGFSRLYLDFHPNEGGVVGQVVRFLHDPDDYRVIASSFEEYLQKIREHDDFMEFIEDVLEIS